MSSTSLLFSTKKRNFWSGGEQERGVGKKASSAPLSSPPGSPPCPGYPEWLPAHLVEVTELPEEDQQLLVELDLLGGVGQVGLEQGVGEQPGDAFEDELEVLRGERVPVQSSSLQRPTNASSLTPP